MKNIAIILFLSVSTVLADSCIANHSRNINDFVTGLKLSNNEAVDSVRSLLGKNSDLLVSGDNNSCQSQEASSLAFGPSKEERSAQLVCNVAGYAFQEELIAAGAANYTQFSHGSWSQTCWLSPRCIITPSSTDEVARAMRIITFLNARFAIRSGGHNPNPGFNSISSNGILVDLRKLNSLKLSDDGLVLSSGPGRRWEDLYKITSEANRTVIGARMPGVGVGGMLLGGGLGTFSAKYGMACDNIRNYEVVLPNSTIVNANSVENPDLFWALKGGGANFGIVTRFDINTHPVSRIWFASYLFASNDTSRVIDAIHAFGISGDTNGAVAVSISQASAYIGLVYAQPHRPDVFKPFFDIPYTAVVVPEAIGSPYDLNIAYEGILNPNPSRFDIQGISTTQDIGIYKAAFQSWNKIAAEVAGKTNGTAKMTFGIQPVNKDTITYSRKTGGNALNVPAINQAWLVATINWNDAAYDKIAHAAVAAAGNAYTKAAEERHGHVAFEYMNDASTNQNPLASYGSKNLRKLKSIARKYDTGRVMQKLQNNGFLLDKA